MVAGLFAIPICIDVQQASFFEIWGLYFISRFAYYFCDEGLYAVRYVLLETHSNDSLYIDDYNEFKSALTKKYGDPIFDLENWENNSKKEYYASKKGDALCYGYLTYETLYSSGRASIVMSMSADNYEISTTIDYVSFDIDPGDTDYSNEV